MEVGKLKTNSQSGEQFLVLHLKEFEELSSGMDLGKLYTHRLQSLRPIAAATNFVNEITPDKDVGSVNSKRRAAIAFEDVYDLSNDYHAENIANVLFWLEHEIEFPVIYRKSKDGHFSTRDNVCDGDVVAIVDALSKRIMMEAGAFQEAITHLGRRRKGAENLRPSYLCGVIGLFRRWRRL